MKSFDISKVENGFTVEYFTDSRKMKVFKEDEWPIIVSLMYSYYSIPMTKKLEKALGLEVEE